VTAAPDVDAWEITERLLTDLAPLAERLWRWLTIRMSCIRILRSQLELLMLRARRSSCDLCWPPGMTCGSDCTG
jgi:hypothetical protein